MDKRGCFQGGKNPDIVVFDDTEFVNFHTLSNISEGYPGEDANDFRKEHPIPAHCQIIILSNRPPEEVIQVRHPEEFNAFASRFKVLELQPHWFLPDWTRQLPTWEEVGTTVAEAVATSNLMVAQNLAPWMWDPEQDKMLNQQDRQRIEDLRMYLKAHIAQQEKGYKNVQQTLLEAGINPYTVQDTLQDMLVSATGTQPQLEQEPSTEDIDTLLEGIFQNIREGAPIAQLHQQALTEDIEPLETFTDTQII